MNLFTLPDHLPPYPPFREGIRRAPDRGFRLTNQQTKIALKNALRYIPTNLHERLAPEFLDELKMRGRIYGYRYRPEGDLKAKPIDPHRRGQDRDNWIWICDAEKKVTKLHSGELKEEKYEQNNGVRSQF